MANTEGNYSATTERPNDIHDNYLVTLESDIWIFGSPILLILGTMGNVLSAVVMLRPGLRKLTTTLYLLALAVVDTLVLYIGLLPKWILHLSGIYVRGASTAACRAHLFFLYTITHLQAWILVCVAIERAAAIFLPHRAKHIFTRKFAAAKMAIIGVGLAIVNCHFWWMYKLVDDKCTHDPYYSRYAGEIFSWIDLAVASLLPFLIVLVANTGIGAKLICANRARKARLNHGTDAKLTSMTAILFSISLVFLLTTAPVAFFINIYCKWYTGTTESYARVQFARTIVNFIFYINFTHNFLLYCVSAPRFRRELLGMLPRRAADSEIAVECDGRGKTARGLIEG